MSNYYILPGKVLYAKEKLMKKTALLIVAMIALLPVCSFAQQGGAFVGAMGLGLTAAQGDFSNSLFFSAGGGFGFEGELRFYLFDGFAIGGMVNYMRFGSTYVSSQGRTSYNFSQLGGTGRLNLIGLSSGSIFINGGGGIFTPNVHYYVPDNSVDESAEKSGYFAFGGLGLISHSDRKVVYELELRYNMGRADFTLDNGNISNVWDFIYAGVKIGFASKGKDAPPKY